MERLGVLRSGHEELSESESEAENEPGSIPRKPKPGQFIVHGTVHRTDGSVVCDADVVAYDIDLRSKQFLGRCTTNRSGSYKIPYLATGFTRKEKGNADLKVFVVVKEGDKPLAESPIHFNAPEVATIDLVIGGTEVIGKTEFQTIYDTITPVLGEMKPENLVEDAENQDISFLVGETGVDRDHLTLFVAAHKAAKDISISAEIFYGLFRGGISSNPKVYFSSDVQTLEIALRLSIENHVMRILSEKEIEAALEQLRDHALKFAAGNSVASSSAVPLSNVLKTKVKNTLPIIKAIAEDDSEEPEEFWAKLASRKDIKDKVEDVQMSIQLGAVTLNHVPLIKHLQSRPDIKTFSDLAKFREKDWVSITTTQAGVGLPEEIPGDGEDEKHQSYAKVMTSMVEDAIPTKFLSHRLNDDDDDKTFGKLPAKADLQRFFRNLPDFDMTSMRLVGLDQETLKKGLEGVENKEAATNTINAIQRLHAIAPRYTQYRPLLTDGLHSSLQIARLSREDFTARYADKVGGHKEAIQIHENASYNHAYAANLLLNFAPGSIKFRPPWRDFGNLLGDKIGNQIPDWRALFGSVDSCTCDGCHAMDGPAAYLVDLLHFLQDRKVIDRINRDSDDRVKSVTYKDQSVKDVLFLRRKDIDYIELTCENTNIVLPYIDLALEIMENAVAPLPPFTPFGLTSPTDTLQLLDKKDIEAIRPQFTSQNITLSNGATITVMEKGKRWVVSDSACAYRIDRGREIIPITLTVISRGQQTMGTAAERAANPQFLNNAAYDQLLGQTWPWNLPFDLNWESVRTYLAHLGVNRVDLMRVFQKKEDLEVLADENIAREALSISQSEAAVIVTGAAPVAEPWRLWGFAKEDLDASSSIPDPASKLLQVTAGRWSTVLCGRVDIFLQQSKLQYAELLDLLAIDFIFHKAPTTSKIQPREGASETTCQLNQLRITGWGVEQLNRVHKFVRVWRKVQDTWSIVDLAKVLYAFRPDQDVLTGAELSDEILTIISHMRELQKQFDIDVETLLAWWKPIETKPFPSSVDSKQENEPKSFFQRLFSNPAVTKEGDPMFLGNPERLSGSITTKAALIVAALNISAQDLAQMVADTDVVTGDVVTLDSLSSLYRHASLAKSLALSIDEYLILLKVSTIKPFDSTATTIMFIRKADDLLQSGLSLSELNWLLRHNFVDGTGINPTPKELTTFLGALRDELQKVYIDNTFDPGLVDEKGDLTKKKLGLLSWDPQVITQIVSVLADKATYETPLETLSIDLTTLPQSLREKVTYNVGSQMLTSSGILNATELETLLALTKPDATTGSPQFPVDSDAINALFDLPRTYIKRNMRSFNIPDFSVQLGSLPADVAIPITLRKKVYYDQEAKQLHVNGALTLQEQEALLKGVDKTASGDYVKAIEDLYKKPEDPALNPDPNNSFLKKEDVDKLFDVQPTPAARFSFVLEKLLPKLRDYLSKTALSQALSQFMGLDVQVTEYLLREIKTSAGGEIISVYLDHAFVTLNSSIKPKDTLFPKQFSGLLLLRKISLLVQKLGLSLKELKWIIEYRKAASDPTAAWLDFSKIPLTTAQGGPALLASFERLIDLVMLRDALPKGLDVLDYVFQQSRTSTLDATALTEDLIKYITERTKWVPDDLRQFIGAESFNFTVPNDFKDEIALSKILRCMKLVRKIGCPAKDAKLLAKTVLTNDDAVLAVNSTKAKYDKQTWEASIARPLRNILRERQRASLVAYLIAKPPPGLIWRNENDVFAHFLIDVQMGPCQLTSRLKQAICSVQLFVQRCLMNMEDDVKVSAEVDTAWLQWKWMKYQNVHAANYRIMIYPENYLEADIRDDQTDFFKNFQTELQQADVTPATVETAFRHYLSNLAEVSRLEVISFYHQEEFSQLDGSRTLDILHIIARTTGQAKRYFYRQRRDGRYWDVGWARVDVDIEGNHVFPVIWNRKLFIFWGIFTERQDPKNVKMPSVGGEVEVSPVWMEIKLAWSQLDGDKWLAKQITNTGVKSPLWSGTDTRMFTFRSVIQESTNILQIQCQASIRDPRPTTGFLGTFTFEAVNQAPEVFNGPYPEEKDRFILLPRDTEMMNMSFRERISFRRIPRGPPGTGWRLGKQLSYALRLNHNWLTPKGTIDTIARQRNDVTILNTTPGLFSIIPAHQDEQFSSQRPFFFQHTHRSFFVEPNTIKLPIWDLGKAGRVRASFLDGNMFGAYWDQNKPRLPVKKLPYTSPLVGGSIRFMQSSALEGVVEEPRASVLSDPTAVAPLADLAIGRRLQETPLAGIPPLASIDIISKHKFPIKVPTYSSTTYQFSLNYHPFVKEFIYNLNRDGVDGLMQRSTQMLGYGPTNRKFKSSYEPTVAVVKYKGEYAEEIVDFDGGSFSVYNWELFYHIPLMIAERLSKNQQFEEAQKWFHYIFDPTDTSTPLNTADEADFNSSQRFWQMKKFFLTERKEYINNTLPELFNFLAIRGNVQELSKLSPEARAALEELEAGVDQWRRDPFKPYLVARSRATAFQKSVVMKYLDNLIAWGDQLFRGDTIEKINNATQIYILASEILGPRPVQIPPRAELEIQTFHSLSPRLDSLSNALVNLEQFTPPRLAVQTLSTKIVPAAPRPTMLFFCTPRNDKLLSYWDTVADRLFKIRNCMNLQGIVRELALFDPPIDPLLLARAVAAGLDIGTALNDMSAPLPNHRFAVRVQKALDITNELRSLGTAFLQALEKKESENLSLLRSKHEVSVLDAVRMIKQRQIDDAKSSLQAVTNSRATVQERYNYNSTRDFMNEWEMTSMGLETAALLGLVIEGVTKVVEGTAFAFPDAKVAAPTSLGITYGGSNLGMIAQAFAAFMHNNAQLVKQSSSMASTLGSFWRRKQDWDYQATLATKELAQIDENIIGAQIKLAIAEKELKNHDLSRSNAKELDDYTKNKFNNLQLYDWTVCQLSTLYFQSYQLAYDTAKKAEMAYAHELAVQGPDFIQFGQWDSLKKGLLTGDKLYHDLKRMDLSYHDLRKREYEITSSISLAQINPLALLQLRENQETFFTLPEAIFDLKYPGHYMRRIKTVAITIPCITGPHTVVNCTLSLLKSSIRMSSLSTGGYARRENDARFVDAYGQAESIVTSTAQNDSGLFDVADQREDRYLPFEGAGAVSSWRLQMPKTFKQFDHRTISDVILHLKYTAREGGDPLRTLVEQELESKLLASIARAEGESGLARLVSARHEFSDRWHALLGRPSASGLHRIDLDLSTSRFPYMFADFNITITNLQVFICVDKRYKEQYNAETMSWWLQRTPANGAELSTEPEERLKLVPWNGIFRANKSFGQPAGGWTLGGKMEEGEMNRDAITDIWIIVGYSPKPLPL